VIWDNQRLNLCLYHVYSRVTPTAYATNMYVYKQYALHIQVNNNF
jgi:hypothetical protein